VSVVIVGIIQRKPVLTDASIVYGILASVNSVN